MSAVNMPMLVVTTTPAGIVSIMYRINPEKANETTITAPIILTPKSFERCQPVLALWLNKETSTQCHITQLVGRRQRRILQASKRLVQALLQCSALCHFVFGGKVCQLERLDVFNQFGSFDKKCSGFHNTNSFTFGI